MGLCGPKQSDQSLISNWVGSWYEEERRDDEKERTWLPAGAYIEKSELLWPGVRIPPNIWGLVVKMSTHGAASTFVGFVRPVLLIKIVVHLGSLHCDWLIIDSHVTNHRTECCESLDMFFIVFLRVVMLPHSVVNLNLLSSYRLKTNAILFRDVACTFYINHCVLFFFFVFVFIKK